MIQIKVDTIDWAHLRTANGTCEKIPEVLTRLCASDVKVRESAYWQIDNHVVLQGDLYEGAPYVVAALLSILDSRPTFKTELYNLLVEFGNGDAPTSEHVLVEESEIPVKAATLEVLAGGIESFWRDVHDRDLQTRKHVAELLLSLSDQIVLDSERLKKAVEDEQDVVVQQILKEALDQLETT